MFGRKHLDLIHSANAEISDFLARASVSPPRIDGRRVEVAELQKHLASIALRVEDVGNALKVSPKVLDTESQAAVALYAATLEHLKAFLISLQSYAEMRRDQLAAHSRKISEALAWCDSARLTTLE